MIRDRLLRAAKKVGQRLLLPEERASVRQRGTLERTSGHVEDELLPPIQDGDGDTPGPNHKSDIGRTWAAAQLLGGAGIVALDVRSPSEHAAGHLPFATLLPRGIVEQQLDLIPGRGTDMFVAVYDATGNQGAGEVAELLRANGWPRARRLVGGYAEWVEEGEEVVLPDPPENGFGIGDTVRLADGRAGTIWRLPRNPKGRYGVLVGTTETAEGAEGDLSR